MIIKEEPVTIEYCNDCTFPIEYCEFGCNQKKIKNKTLKNEIKKNITEIDPSIKIKITVKNIKNKIITIIENLDNYNINPKEVHKFIGKKIGCGCSVNGKTLEIQGPQSDKVIEFFLSDYSSIFNNDSFEVEDISKKKNKK